MKKITLYNTRFWTFALKQRFSLSFDPALLKRHMTNFSSLLSWSLVLGSFEIVQKEKCLNSSRERSQTRQGPCIFAIVSLHINSTLDSDSVKHFCFYPLQIDAKLLRRGVNLDFKKRKELTKVNCTSYEKELLRHLLIPKDLFTISIKTYEAISVGG